MTAERPDDALPPPSALAAEVERVATVGASGVQLATAMLCVDCEWIYEAQPDGCPRCESRAAFAVARVIRPLGSRAVLARIDKAAGLRPLTTDPPRADAAEGER